MLQGSLMGVSPQSSADKQDALLPQLYFFFPVVIVVSKGGGGKFPDDNMRECNGNDMQATASLPHLAVKLSSS